MKVEFLKAAEADFDEVVDFANYVFSHDGGKTDFPSLLPKLYKKDYQMMETTDYCFSFFASPFKTSNR